VRVKGGEGRGDVGGSRDAAAMIAAALIASKVASTAPAVVGLPVVQLLHPSHPFSGKQPDLPVPPAALQVSDVSRTVAYRGGLMLDMLGACWS